MCNVHWVYGAPETCRLPGQGLAVELAKIPKRHTATAALVWRMMFSPVLALRVFPPCFQRLTQSVQSKPGQ